MTDNQKYKILLVEDDINLGTILKEFFVIKNYDVLLAKDGENGRRLFNSGDFDLCILDIMMPRMDGFTLAKIMREKDKEIPIIFLTAKSMLEDKILGFEIGADDYITKPFSTEELFLRIEAIIKRTKKSTNKFDNTTCKIGQYKFDYSKRILLFAEKKYSLTSKEAELLKLFCANVNEVLPRRIALEMVWTENNYFTSRSMDVYVAKLRKYLREDSSISIINVHGKGFKLLVE